MPFQRRIHPLTLGLVVANVVLVWVLPVLPAQDIPQHLAHARIFADYGSLTLPFHDYYELPSHYQPYDSVYLLLAFLGRLVPITAALRVVMTGYVLLVFWSFHLLVAACRDDDPGSSNERARPPASGALASLTVWSSVVLMGFLQYFLAVPVVLIALALLVRASEDPDRSRAGRAFWGAGAASALVASIHLVAGAAVALFAVLYAALDWKDEGRARRVHAAFMVVSCCALALAVWHVEGEVLGAGVRPASMNFREAFRQAQGFEFVNSLLQLTWYDPPVTLNYVTWASLGPYRWGGLVAPLVAMTWLAISVYRAKPLGERSPRERRYQRAAWGFFAFACFTPWGIAVPAELTYLNFRLIALAVALLLAGVPPRWFAAVGPRQGLGVACVVAFLNFAVHALLFAREARPAMRLMAKAAAAGGGPLLQLAFHNTSAYFAKGFRVTHALPMYYTVLYGGVCTQFWARYTPHLPIGYRPGMRPAQPDDWSPRDFDADKHLEAVQWVLMQGAGDGESRDNYADAAEARAALEERTERVDCDGLWCLYRVRK